MLNLLLSTFEMMGLTFIIGFIVAGIIKLIAFSADSLEYHHSHNEELIQLSKLHSLHAKVGELLGIVVTEKNQPQDDEREQYRLGINKDILYKKPSGYYHGVSHGVSHLDLMDYYYPRDTRVMFLKKQEQLIKSQNKTNTTKKEEPSSNK